MREVEHAESRYKRTVKVIFILFIATLLILTLYSNTILTMNLPKVWVEEGGSDPLVQNYTGSGLLQPISQVELFNQAGWIVNDVLVKEGERVVKGQTLVKYDSREAENTIQDEIVNLSRQNLMMEGLQESYIEAVQSEDEVKIRSAKRDIEVARLSISVQERKINNLQENLESLRQVAAPFDGYVSKITAVKGLPSGSTGRDVLLSNSNLGYQFALQIPSSIVNQMELGDKVNVEVKMKSMIQTMKGSITEIENVLAVDPVASTGDGGENTSSKPMPQKHVLIGVQSQDLQGGEQASITLSKSSVNDKGVLLPLKAIHGEGTNKFIFVLEEKKGPLGNTYHANKVSIEVGESNEYEAVVLKGAYPGQSIITESSEPLQDNSRVRKK